MATSGRRLPAGGDGGLRPAVAALLAALLAVLILAGASALGLAGCGSQSAGSQGGAATPAEAGRALVTPHMKAAPGWSHVPAPVGWARVLKEGVIPLSRRYAIVPMALAGDGRTLFATLHSHDWSGVVRIDTQANRFTRIHEFDDRVNDQAGGCFDGRWLVWTEWNSPWDQTDFTIWSWDSRSGAVRRIGAAIPNGEGSYWPGSWEDAIDRAGYAAWEQGSGPDSLGQIHVYDLAKGRDRIVREGHPGGDVLLLSGDRVAWTESMSRGVKTIVRTATTTTGRLLVTPPALAGLRGLVGLVTDGRSIVFTRRFWHAVWWAPTLNDSPRELFKSMHRAYTFGNPLALAGRYLCFAMQPRTFVADLETRRFCRLPGGGWVIMDEAAMVIMPPNDKKALHLVTDVIFLPMSRLKGLLP